MDPGIIFGAVASLVAIILLFMKFGTKDEAKDAKAAAAIQIESNRASTASQIEANRSATAEQFRALAETIGRLATSEDLKEIRDDVKEIRTDLKEAREDLGEVKDQTTKTNGRVNAYEAQHLPERVRDLELGAAASKKRETSRASVKKK